MNFNDLLTISAQGSPFSDVREQLNRMVTQRSASFFARGHARRATLQTKAKVIEQAAWIKTQVLESIGGLDFEACDLHIVYGQLTQTATFSVVPLRYQARPGVWVSGLLYRPLVVQSPVPGVLLACGHQREGKHAEEYQLVAQVLVAQGFVVLAIDPLGQGERFSYLEPETGKPVIDPVTIEHDHAGYQCQALGDSLARYLIHDHQRALDVLESLDDVDPTRLAVTGNSGGGTMTAQLMVVEPRLKAAVPATFIMSREAYQKTGQAQDREQHWVGLGELDHVDFFVAFAPRPVLVLGATHDFFPISAARSTVEQAQSIYRVMEAESLIEFREFPISHSYPPEMAEAAGFFLRKVLMNQDSPHLPPLLSPLAPSQVTISHQGQLLLETHGLMPVFHANKTRLAYWEDVRRQHQEAHRRAQAHAWLSERVNANRQTTDLNPRRGASWTIEDGLRVEQWVIQTQTDMEGLIWMFSNPNLHNPPVVLAFWPRGSSALVEHEAWIKEQCRQGRRVMVVDLSGFGALTQRQLIWWAGSTELYGSLYKLHDDLTWLDDGLALLRTYETLVAVRYAQQLASGAPLQVYTEGYCSVYAELAQFIEPFDATVTSINRFESYAAWIKTPIYPTAEAMHWTIPGILRYTDLDEIRHWIHKGEL